MVRSIESKIDTFGFNRLMYTATNLAQKIQALEELLLKPEVRTNSIRVSELLADDFFEIGASGRTFDKAAIVQSLSNETEQLPKLTIAGFQLVPLSENLVQARYSILESGTLRSSLWRKESDEWVMFFHQGTIERTK